MPTDALKWARKQGLSNTHYVQAEILRQLCRISLVLCIIAAGTTIIAAIKVFGS